MIQPGNEGVVHHMVMYTSIGDMDDDNHGVAWNCIADVMPNQYRCYIPMFIWAVEGNVSIKITIFFFLFQ